MRKLLIIFAKREGNVLGRMYLFIYLFIYWFVCMLTTFLKNYLIELHEIFRDD